MAPSLHNQISELLSIITTTFKCVVLGLGLAAVLAIVTTIAEAAQGDYCLGIWSNEVGDYCERVRVASTALAMDRKVGMGFYGAVAQIDAIKKTYNVPKRLSSAIIEVLWNEELIDPETLHPMQFGAGMEGQCIDYYDDIVKWE